jgi:hypothetical protein
MSNCSTFVISYLGKKFAFNFRFSCYFKHYKQNLQKNLCFQLLLETWWTWLVEIGQNVTIFINRNHVICNHSRCKYVQLNVAYNYEWFLVRLFFKLEWILVFLSISCEYDLFYLFNRLIFHDVFVFFITSFIHLIAHATKVITL